MARLRSTGRYDVGVRTYRRSFIGLLPGPIIVCSGYYTERHRSVCGINLQLSFAFWGVTSRPICDSLRRMNANRDALPDDIAALKEALTVERAKGSEVAAELVERGESPAERCFTIREALGTRMVRPRSIDGRTLQLTRRRVSPESSTGRQSEPFPYSSQRRYRSNKCRPCSIDDSYVANPTERRRHFRRGTRGCHALRRREHYSASGTRIAEIRKRSCRDQVRRRATGRGLPRRLAHGPRSPDHLSRAITVILIKGYSRER